MKNFIKPPHPKGEPDLDKMDNFIEQFNHYISYGTFSLNTVLNPIPTLTEEEFKLVRLRAKANGYELVEIDDEHDSITYRLTEI